MGTFMSVFRPVTDTNGKVTGVIGADIEVVVIKEALTKEVILILLPVFGFALLLSLLMSLILRRSIVMPILAINHALSTIAEGEGNTEISGLSRSFNTFQAKLSSLINKTRAPSKRQPRSMK
jgi:methyl-accepting chemotaxis protein